MEENREENLANVEEEEIQEEIQKEIQDEIIEEMDDEPIEVQTINTKPVLYSQLINLLQSHHLCLECIGRQFSYLATATDNKQRANALLLGLTMEAHGCLLSSTVEKKNNLYNKDPLEILQILGNNANFKPALVLIERWKRDHPGEKFNEISISTGLSIMPDPLKSSNSIDSSESIESTVLNKSNNSNNSIEANGSTNFMCNLCGNLLHPDFP